jgi:hypothetical protein
VAAGDSVLVEATAEPQVEPMQVLHLAWHSLGGAMASLRHRRSSPDF